jgi:DNA (cytosine-5)-methyltransferase 1
MTRPLLLDLFCGAGGSAVGYHRAGFDVIGVDIRYQSHYPFAPFVHGDALDFLRDPTPWTIGDFDAIHASPPCQRYSLVQRSNGDAAQAHPDLLPVTRELLRSTGLPYVIENVVGAPMRSPLLLCGEMFELDVIRHRLFESDTLLMQPHHPRHRGRVSGWRHGIRYDGPYVAAYGHGGGKADVDDCRRAMRIDWMTNRQELIEAIPPAYTEYIGTQLLDAVRAAA